MRIDFDTANKAELDAVAALIASLGGCGGVTMSGQELPELSTLAPGNAATVAPSLPIGAIASDAPTGGHSPLVAEALSGGIQDVDAAQAFGGAAPLAPAPVASPPALPTTGAASAGSAPAVELDATGLPWDKRIHSTPASKKQNGEWRGKRGLDETTRAAVTAELRQAMGAPSVGESIPAVTTPAATAPEAGGVAVASEPAPVAVPAPPVAPVPAPPVPTPPAPVAGPAATFADLMRKITGLQTQGRLTVEQTTEISASLGLTGVRDLMHRPDLIPAFDQLLPVAG